MTAKKLGPGRLFHFESPLSGSLRLCFSVLVILLVLVSLPGCGMFSTRPAHHLGYAEAAYLAAQRANAETNAPQSFQLARETLYRARASFRLKNFKEARRLAVRARLLAEEAEFQSTFKDLDPKLNPQTNPPE